MNLENIVGDLLVVDFTEYHQKHPNETIPSEGVMFIEQPDNRLGAFCILNPQHLPFETINIEENPTIVTDDNGKLVKQCECICRAKRENGRRWVLLLELKYCSEKNIPANMQNAFDKLDKCFDFLKNTKHYFDNQRYRIYLCASHPEHETVKPFGEFIYNQKRLLELNDKGAKFLYCNAVKILTPEYLAKSDIPRKYRFGE